MGINEKGKIEFSRLTFYLSMFTIVASALLVTGSSLNRLEEAEKRLQAVEQKAESINEIKVELKYISKTLDELRAELRK